jgi:hypothetical protein
MDAISAALPAQNAPLTLKKIDGRKTRKRTEAELAALARGRAIALANRSELARLRKLDSAKVEDELQKRIMGAMPDLIRWAMMPAKGCSYVYRVEKKEGERGKEIEKHVLVQDAHEIASALDAISNDGGKIDETYYYITTDKPDFRAIEMLLNRGFGRPSENKKVDITKRTYSLVEISARAEQLVREGKLG